MQEAPYIDPVPAVIRSDMSPRGAGADVGVRGVEGEHAKSVVVPSRVKRFSHERLDEARAAAHRTAGPSLTRF